MKSYEYKLSSSEQLVHDEFVIKQAFDLIKKRYVKNKHHVACVLYCGGSVYSSLHLDNDGFDICAEPIALSNALYKQETQFDKIVSVFWNGDNSCEPKIVSPCGNCRQIMAEHTPDLEVILLNKNGDIIKKKASELLPEIYTKP